MLSTVLLTAQRGDSINRDNNKCIVSTERTRMFLCYFLDSTLLYSIVESHRRAPQERTLVPLLVDAR